MTDSRHLVDTLIDETADLLDTDASARDVLLERRLLAEHQARAMSNDPVVESGRTRRRVGRVRRTGIGAVLAGATAIVLVVALGPGGSSTSRSHLPSPDSAQAALRQAGESAADADWTPLGQGDYFHLSTSTFTPDIPEHGDDPNGTGSMFLGGVHASETWIGRDAAGQILTIEGGTGDPKRFPSIYRDPKTGKILSTGSTTPKPGEVVDVESALKFPNTVNLMAWPRGDRAPFQRGWVRTRTGYIKMHDFVMNEQTMGRAQTPANTMQQFWAAPVDVIDAANENPDPDAAVRDLIDHQLDDPHAGFRDAKSGTVSMGGIEEKPVAVSDEELDRETGIEYAVLLLGTAPLSPDVRHALFNWLARQPGAEVRADAKDELGRDGTEITFESVREVPVPPYSVTAAEILAENKGVRGISQIDADAVFKVSDNVQRRRWRVSFMVDPDSGELLQQYFYFRQGRSGKRPLFTVYRDGPKIEMRDPGGGSGGGGAQLFLARERTTAIEPVAAICESQPQVCR